MSEIEFNPGHLEAIRGFLEPGKDTITPEDLANKGKDTAQVEMILFVLQQELSNTAFPIPFLGMLVEDIETSSQEVTDENMEKLASDLDGYAEIMRKATQNAVLIMECMRRIQETERALLEAGLSSLLNEKSQDYIDKIVSDDELIQRSLEGKIEAYNKTYNEGLQKLNQFLGE